MSVFNCRRLVYDPKIQQHFAWSEIDRFPFDDKNLLGYSIAFVLEYVMLAYLIFFIMCIISFGIGSYYLVISLTNDLKGQLDLINEHLQTKRNRLQAIKEMYEFIQFDSDTKQLSIEIRIEVICSEIECESFSFRLVKDLSSIFQPIFLAVFSWCISALVGSLLMFQIDMAVTF